MREGAIESEALPEDEEDGRRGFNLRLLLGLAVVALAAVYMIFLSLDAASALYVTVDQVIAPGSDVYDRRLRVAGTVALESVVRGGGEDRLEVRFVVQGEDSAARLPVLYRGAVPDIFGEGVTVFVEGIYDREGVFNANVLLARHPDTMEVLEKEETKPPGRY